MSRLIFPSSSDKIGRPYAIAEHSRASAETACRELIQNALDAHAARATADEAPCAVTFKVEKIKSTEIPGIDEYRETIDRCLKVWKHNESVHPYLANIAKFAKRDEMDVLYVSDNGIGFGEKNLQAVLNEGTPEKVKGSSGSFGIGHLTIFGLSGLQYVFYAGKGADGRTLAAGHALLSSFRGEDSGLYSHQGYYVEDYRNDFFDRFQFCLDKNIPKPIRQELNQIEKTGSLVAAYGFNYFRETGDSSELANEMIWQIRNAVANNFALAIISGKLNVTVQHYAKESQSIEPASIVDFLEKATPDEPNYRNAQLTLDTIAAFRDDDSMRGNLTGKFQDCKCILKNRTAKHSVSVWRNGMLITRTHRGLSRSRFGGKKFFNCIVLLSGAAKPQPYAHDLIKKSESPLHDRIERQRLEKKDLKELANLLEEIRKWILENAADSGGESFDLRDDILLGSGTTTETRVHRRPEVRIDDDGGLDEDIPEPGGKGGGGNGGGGSSRGARGKLTVTSKNYVNAKVQGKFLAKGPYRVRFVPHKDIPVGVVNLLIDSGQDLSCTGRIKEQDIHIHFATAEDGSKIEVKDLSILVYNLKKNVPVTVDCELNLPRAAAKDISIVCLLGELRKEHKPGDSLVDCDK